MDNVSKAEPLPLEPDALWKILAGVAREAANRNDYDAAAQYYFRSMRSARETFGADDLRVAFILLECADLSCRRGDAEAAEQYLRKAKRILRQQLRSLNHFA